MRNNFIFACNVWKSRVYNRKRNKDIIRQQMLLSAQRTRGILHSYEDVIVISLFKFKVYDQIIIFQGKKTLRSFLFQFIQMQQMRNDLP